MSALSPLPTPGDALRSGEAPSPASSVAAGWVVGMTVAEGLGLAGLIVPPHWQPTAASSRAAETNTSKIFLNMKISSLQYAALFHGLDSEDSMRTILKMYQPCIKN